MSILIKGMEMPRNCMECNRAVADMANCIMTKPEAWKRAMGIGRQPECPLIEIPTPHGRLIDADVVIQTLKRSIDLPYNKRVSVSWSDAFDSFVDRLEEQDVIIEAEGGKEE